MIGTFTIICTVAVVGAIAEKLATEESTKEVIKIGTFGLSGVLVIRLIFQTYKTIKSVINGD